MMTRADSETVLTLTERKREAAGSPSRSHGWQADSDERRAAAPRPWEQVGGRHVWGRPAWARAVVAHQGGIEGGREEVAVVQRASQSRQVELGQGVQGGARHVGWL